MTPNLTAFLTMLATSEGTLDVPGNDNGYNVLVGRKLFDGYTDHPRIVVDMGRGLKSSAAGRYQILARVFDAYRDRLKLADFSPASQDAIAVQLIRECRALDLIDAGKIRDAIVHCSSRWASLPGAGYGQKENSLQGLIKAYQQAGGVEWSHETLFSDLSAS